MAGPSSGGFGRLNHTIEKTVAKRVAGKVGVSVKARQFPGPETEGGLFSLDEAFNGRP